MNNFSIEIEVTATIQMVLKAGLENVEAGDDLECLVQGTYIPAYSMRHTEFASEDVEAAIEDLHVDFMGVDITKWVSKKDLERIIDQVEGNL